MDNNKLFHIAITKNQGAKYAILPGAPERVEMIAEFLDESVFLAKNREFTSYIGNLYGERVIVTSTGIGGPSAAIALEELHIAGVHTAIRIGTCGGMQKYILPGDLVIATGAVRMEGTSKEYAPVEFPAVADFSVVSALVRSAAENGYKFHTGIIQSKDSFYGQHDPKSMPVGYELSNKWEAWKRCGVLASEMETAALFTVAQIRKIKMGCILHALWNQELDNGVVSEGESNSSYADFDTTSAIKTAVDALKILISSTK